MTPFLTEVTTSLVCVVSMAEALLIRVWCSSDRDRARARHEAGSRVAKMASGQAVASIGVRRNQRQRRAKRILPAARAVVMALLLLLSGSRARAAAPSGGGRWLLTSTPMKASGTGRRDTRVW